MLNWMFVRWLRTVIDGAVSTCSAVGNLEVTSIGDHSEAICVYNQFISNASLVPLLSLQITMQSKVPAAIWATKSPGGRQREFSEPRESREVPEPAVTLSMAKGQIRGMLYRMICRALGQKQTHPAGTQPGMLCLQRKALPWPFTQTGGIAPCAQLTGVTWLGAAQQGLESAVV